MLFKEYLPQLKNFGDIPRKAFRSLSNLNHKLFQLNCLVIVLVKAHKTVLCEISSKSVSSTKTYYYKLIYILELSIPESKPKSKLLKL
jgi:hypothetical protein